MNAAPSIAAGSSAFRPPAPRPLDKPLGLFALLAALRTNPMTIWTRAHYEEPILIGKVAGQVRAVVNDPAGIKRVFLDNAANYRKDDLQLRVLKPGLGESILTTDGDVWRAQRRLLAPIFAPRQVTTYATAMADCAAAMTDRFAQMAPGARIDMAGEMARFAIEVLEHTLFSTGLGPNALGFREAVKNYFETAARVDPLDVLGAPDFLPRIGRLRAKGTLRWFNDMVRDVIEARRALFARGEAPPNDILSLLLNAQDPETGLGMSEEMLRSNVTTLIGAGYETTATALTWTFYLLSQAPDWRARVEQEADAELDAGPIESLAERMPVARAVLEESMRVYPPAALLSRMAIGEDEICGRRIPAGTIVTVSPFVLHRHRKLWTDPDVFDPTRFLGANRDRIDRFAYIPFGAGPRVCIGMGFAMQEALIALAHLARRFRFDCAPGHKIDPVQRITLSPKGGMPMIVQPR